MKHHIHLYLFHDHAKDVTILSPITGMTIKRGGGSINIALFDMNSFVYDDRNHHRLIIDLGPRRQSDPV
jgi:hypothetical protein